MAITKEIFIDVETGEAVKNVNKLNQSVENVEQSSKDLQKQNESTTKGFKGVATAVKSVGTALKAAGIGLVIALFAKLADMLSQNQKFMDFFSTATNTLSIAFQDLFNVFDEGLPSLEQIGTAIKDNIIERFNSAIEVGGLLGKALKQLFEGDFAGALDTAKEAGKELVDVVTGVDGSVDKVINYGEEVLETASAFTELTNQAALAEAQLRRVFEQADRDAEIQRRIRDDFNKSFEERLAASEELARILDEQEETQLRLAGLEVARAQQAIRISGDNIENQVALTNALAEQDAIEADIAGRRAEQEAQDRMLRQEILTARQEEIGQTLELDNLVTDNKKKNLDQQVQDTLDANARTKEANEQLAAANAAIAQKEAAAKEAALDATGQALTNLSLIAGQETAAGKALAIAASLINTYQGITKSIAVGGFAGIAQAVAVGAAGFAAVANIVKTPVPNEGGAQAKGSAPSAPAAPSFNVVGTSPINQVAETLNQDQEPVQAFVVGSNVTTQQELDRNIVDTATIG